MEFGVENSFAYGYGLWMISGWISYSKIAILQGLGMIYCHVMCLAFDGHGGPEGV